MFKLISRINIFVIFFYFILISPLKTEIIKEINIEGNQRISPETIKMFTGVSVNDNLSDNDLNQILKKLYDTTFFDLVSIKFVNNKLEIIVKENPIIQNINYKGIKSSKILALSAGVTSSFSFLARTKVILAAKFVNTFSKSPYCLPRCSSISAASFASCCGLINA